jgi:hypothetical protein
MVGLTKRQVQAGKRDDFEGASSKATRLGESTEQVQWKLHRHFNETAFLQGQWRVRWVEWWGDGRGAAASAGCFGYVNEWMDGWSGSSCR